jgi:hypothetical protein
MTVCQRRSARRRSPLPSSGGAGRAGLCDRALGGRCSPPKSDAPSLLDRIGCRGRSSPAAPEVARASGDRRKRRASRARPLPAKRVRCDRCRRVRQAASNDAGRQTTSCARVARRVRACRHSAPSPTLRQMPKRAGFNTFAARASKTRALKAGVSRHRHERREGWTFTLRTCRTDFPLFASLPSSGLTVKSVRGSLGSDPNEQRPWLASSHESGSHQSHEAGSLQSGLVPLGVAQPRVLVPKLGRTSYMGAGKATPIHGGGRLARVAPGSQCARRCRGLFTATVRERYEPMSPPREELGARWI